MKKNLIVRSVCLVAGWIMLLGGSSSAQVITPPMNPTTPFYMSAASGWREVPTVGLSYFDMIGSRNLSGSNIYEYTGSGYSANVFFNMGERLAFEGYFYDDVTEVQKDVYYDGTVNFKTTVSQGTVTLSHEGFAVFGIGMRTHETTDYISDAYPKEVTTRMGTIPSMSIRLGSVIYVGGGVEIVKESSTYAVNNHWIDTTAALAIMTQKSEGLQFRLEASVTNSPEASATAKQGYEASDHNKTTTTRANLDLQYKGLVFEAFSTDTREAADLYDASSDTKVEEIHSVNTQVGFLIAPNKGIVLGFHFRSDTTEQLYKDKKDSFRVSLAYNFGGE